MDNKSTRKLVKLDIHDYDVEFEPGILEILRASFGEQWGDAGFWRWKHSGRPGFVPSEVVVFAEGGRPVACFHMTVRSVQLIAEVGVTCTVEGDYAIRPEARGTGLLPRMYSDTASRLVARGVVLRAGFTAPELHGRVYQQKFGHRLIPTVTADYRKILSDRALRDKLRQMGEALRVRPFWHRILERNDLTIRVSVGGFQACTLVLARNSSTCIGELDRQVDLTVRVPYEVLAAGRLRDLPAMFVIVRSILFGQVQVAGLLRTLFIRVAEIVRR
jgi:Acetyltransferase (GNAT) domain